MLVIKDIKILKEETVIDKKNTFNTRSLDQIFNDGMELNNKFELNLLNNVIQHHIILRHIKLNRTSQLKLNQEKNIIYQLKFLNRYSSTKRL